MIIINKDEQRSPEEIAFLNKVLQGSLKNNVFHMLNGTDNKLQIIDNWAEERKELPKGYIIEVYNRDDKLIFQSVQGSVNAYIKKALH